MTSDPSVLDMIKAVQPLMGPLQRKVRQRSSVPERGDDIVYGARSAGPPDTHRRRRAFMHPARAGPGFTRLADMWPNMSPLAPRVLAFAANYEADTG